MAPAELERFVAQCEACIAECRAEIESSTSRTLPKPPSKLPSTDWQTQPLSPPSAHISHSAPILPVHKRDERSLDPDTLAQQDLTTIDAGNQVLDQQLEQVAFGVQQLKALALNMDSEVTQQNELLPEIQAKTDMVDIQLEKAETRVRKLVARLEKSHLVTYIILALIEAGLVAYFIFAVVQ